MDIKSSSSKLMTSTSRSMRKRSTKKKNVANVPLWKRVPLNYMVQRHTWDYGVLSTGTTGVLSFSDMSPSIQNFTEYSTLSSLFLETRLISCSATFISLDANAADVAQGALYVGTNMSFTANTHTTPTSASQVENLPGMKIIPTQIVAPVVVQMVVPKDLEYSLITADSPATPTPWAGSPGNLVGLSTGTFLTTSRRYFFVKVTAIHEFRGRI